MQREAEPTIADVLESVRDLSIHVDSRIDGLEKDLGILKDDVGTLKATMVTKDYLDDKLGDLKGDMVGLVRKEYDKTERLVGILEEDRVISSGRVAEIRNFEVFPRPPVV